MHIDMNSYFASCEQQDMPAWRGRPLGVCEHLGGIIIAPSVEAKRWGVKTGTPVWEAKKLYPKIILTPTQFLTLFETRTTPAFLRSLTDSLLVGVTVGTENHTFLLIKSNSYPNSFSGMLTWERGMFDDMKDFFSIPANSVTNISLFKDKVVKNQDTRVLVDDTGKTVLLYTFLGSNQDLLLITNNEAVVGIVADRLTQAKLAQ